MYGECWRTGKEEWAVICCAALTAWDGGGRWDISLSRLKGCGNERTRKLKATVPCNQFLSSTLAIRLVLQSCLVFPNTLASGSQPLCPMHIPNPAYRQCPARNTLPPLTESKTKETNQRISPRLHCLPSGKIATNQIYHASKAFEIRGCSRWPKKSSREHDAWRWGNDAQPPQEWCSRFETQGWKMFLKQQLKLLWEQMRKAMGCHVMPGKNGLNKYSKLGATSWPNTTLLSTQPRLGNGALISRLCYSRIYDIKEKQ